MDAHVDHTTGLLVLREGAPLSIYCTEPVFDDLTKGHPILSVLEHFCGIRHFPIPLEPESSFRVEGVDSLLLEALPLESKPPPFSPHRHEPRPGDNIGLRVRDDKTGGTLFYAPGVGRVDETLLRGMMESDCVMVDGTFFTDDELVTRGIAQKRAQDMGHLPQSGDDGMLSVLQRLPEKRRILIHINNTNPILDEESEARRAVEAAGVEVAYDGMEVVL